MAVLSGNTGNNTLNGTALADTLNGLAGNDTLAGGAGNDRLDGGSGADRMSGGAGNDIYIVDNVNDRVIENASEGADTVSSTVTFSLSANVENLVLTGASATTGTGNTLNNSLTGNTNANTLRGNEGNDTLNGGAGSDFLFGGTGNDVFVVDSAGDIVIESEGEGTDTISSSISLSLANNVENLVLTGTANRNGTGNTLNNRLTGNSGNNILNGGAGDDTLTGGRGNDIYIVDSVSDTVIEGLNEGSDIVSSSVNFTLSANIENLVLTGTNDINATGNTLANRLTGNTGNNTLSGGVGADTMTGGAGNDTYVVDNTGDSVVESADQGADTVSSSISYTLGSNVENLVLTGTANLNATGNTLDNVLTGNSGNNRLNGGAGDDTLTGGEGNDVYVIDSVDDSIIEDASQGTDTVSASFSYTLLDNFENLTLTGVDDLDATGNASTNILTGNSGANILDGGAGVDTMVGGAGNDTYIVDDATETITEAANGGTDTVSAGITFTLGAEVENLVLTGTDNLDGYGNTLANTLTGNSGDNVLDGAAGADTLIGGVGNDTYVVDNTGDVVQESLDEGTDIVSASASFTLGDYIESLVLVDAGVNINATGNAQDNTLTGNTGNNILDGGAGNDTLTGGTGNDTYVIDSVDDSIVEAASEGTDTVVAGFTYTLLDDFENLTLSGSASNDAYGNAVANVLTGNSGDNLIDGLGGTDTMVGGAGNDTYLVDDSSEVITEADGGGTDTVSAGVSYTLSNHIENLILTEASNINGSGNTLANTLTGNIGDNVLDGGAGADTLTGGEGNDTYVVDNTGDVLVESAFQGSDTVSSSVIFTLAADFESLVLTGTNNINGVGNDDSNTITGNDGNNLLDGGLGSDTLTGGLGNDTYVLDSSDDSIVEATGEGTDTVSAGFNYTLLADFENLVLTGDGDLEGTGNALNNVLTGNSGSNLLDGAAGSDTMAGGAGDDTYVVDAVGDLVTESLNAGTDTVSAGASFTLGANIENLILTGVGNNNAVGNSSANNLIGNGGNNLLDGAAGADTLIGGAGDDTYVVDNTGDVVVEDSSAGADAVSAAITYTLGDEVENLTLTGTSNINATGNAVANVLTGNSGNNILDGAEGDDTMSGGVGNDTYVLDSANDSIIETSGQGTDTVSANFGYTLLDHFENLVLTSLGDIDGGGNAAANILTGNSGANVLDGAAGVDTMIGGAGNDTYIVDATGEVVTESASGGTDTVSSSVSFTLSSEVENLVLTTTGNINGVGNASDNEITGNAGNNRLDGAGGADALTGGDGDDTYVVDNAGDTVTEASNEGNDTVSASVNYTLGANVENLVLTGTLSASGVGNALDNQLTGNSAGNFLDGDAGADTMVGGAGNDTYVVDDAGDVVTEAVSGGTDTVSTALAYTLSANVENLVLTGGSNVNGVGNALSNRLTGNGGDNTLDGDAGVDTLIGGAGDDTYIVGSTGEVVIEAASEGSDVVSAGVSFTLGSEIETLILTGGGNINGVGNGSANTILGNAGNNRLDGGAGADTLTGGLGDDTYVVDDAGDSLVEANGAGTDTVSASLTYTLLADFENLTLTGASAIDGYGNAAGNVLTGNTNNNLLDGDAGADTMLGGAGNDTYVVDDANDVVTESLNAGTDTVSAGVAYTLGSNIENLVLTGGGNNNGGGNALANSLTGNGGDNILSGGTGVDTMIGGAGDDTYIVDATGEVVTEAASEGSDTVSASVSFTLGSEVESLVLTGVGSISGTGNTDNNTITGNAGNNRLDGGVGDDTLTGGAGNDTYVVDSANDSLVEGASAGTDTVSANLTYTLIANFENLTLYDGNNINAYGNGVANVLTGNAGNNILDGLVGADTMIGAEGDDTYLVDSASDIVTEIAGGGNDSVSASVSYTLSGDVENLVLTGVSNLNGTGSTANNVLVGNDGNNRLDGGTGADTLGGGLGDDVYVVDNTGDTVTEAASEGSDTVSSSVTFTLGANVESLVLTGTSSVDGAGNGDNNVLTGNSGNNVLDGGAGDDTMSGGNGNDTYVIDSANDSIIEVLGQGTDTVSVGSTYTLLNHFENLVLTGGGNINGTGNTAANVLTGNAGNNTLDGGTGVDTMVGGAGDDIYIVDSGSEVITELASGGDDTVSASVSYTLSNEVENLVLTGTANSSLTGNSSANTLTANGGNNTLNGGAGADTMVGGAGNDTYIVDNTGDTVTEAGSAGTDSVSTSVTYTLAANVENLILTGTGAIDGYGNALNNAITGNNGNNILDGDSGNDTLTGGAGNDTYIIDSASDLLVESANQGTDTVSAGLSYTLLDNFENLVLTGGGNINATGNAATNTLTGNAGDNILSGGGGVDTMIGGAGDDTYIVDSALEQITEGGSAGSDTVSASISFTLGANLESLVLTGTSSINATGNTADNTLTGNAGNNRLDGGAGVDTLVGGLGNDIYIIDNTGDAITESSSEGTDVASASVSYTLSANVENLVLTGTANLDGAGNATANTLTGNAGNNTLDGGAGADTLVGGSGNDTYIVDNVGDVVTEAISAGTDTVSAAISYTLVSNVENLVLTGGSNLNGFGNNLANSLTGNGGNNTLDGLAGVDTMTGGAGDDTYIVDDEEDTVVEASSEGTDTVSSSVTYVLSDNVERLTLTGTSNIWGTGNALDNTLTGNSGSNNLTDNAGGNDTFNGGAGSDILIGGAGNDNYLFSETDGADNVVDAEGTDDRIIFDNTVAAGELAFFRDNNDLVIGYTGSTNTIRITNQFNSENPGVVERIQLSNGNYLNDSDIQFIVDAVAQYATDNSITLSSIDDVRSNSALMAEIAETAWRT